MRGTRYRAFWNDERGHTLPEILTAVAIAGVLTTIAVIIFLALLERWRVEAAADQLASDMRLAHSDATQGLTDWRVVMKSGGMPLEGCSEADYCLLKLKFPYVSDGAASADSAPPALAPDTPPTPKWLPRGTKIKEFTFRPDCSDGGANAVVAPSRCGADDMRTLEFNSNGTVRTLRPGQSGTVRVSSDDGSPSCGLVFQAATSNVRIGEIVYG